MSLKADVEVLEEVIYDDALKGKSWVLCFQWCTYHYSDGTSENGYRFIWRRPDGSLQPAMGQARIPNIFVAETLMSKAKAEGWGFNSNSTVKSDNK
ncbi:hypothetical protein [Sporolactobacillus terrae]|uniref:hypothetical protein n=1 Tax=Sporolactobacillus terrae TaxID=269673 RepID=UPI001CC0CA9A|nr:hypothetical protein [Sporolactobacillus terrae]UAK17546.1 hypothetical protein K7399_06365 [Sporolactobacillus terrae]